MAFALHFRSHPWHPISTAPCNRGVELRVREGTAVSTLEFPCRQTNAGDWINCDFGTPINIQPVEWRAWQHGHSPQSQSPQINIRGRLTLPHRDHRSAKRSSPGAVKLADRPVRRRQSLATIGYALIGIVVVATAVGSLTRISAWALPVGLTAPPSAIAVSSTAAAASPSPAENSCKEFGPAFLNSACATPHKRFAGRRIHRVATFVIGRSDAQQ
jgi:hypothetical protein